jgi:hypothetical protein
MLLCWNTGEKVVMNITGVVASDPRLR